MPKIINNLEFSAKNLTSDAGIVLMMQFFENQKIKSLLKKINIKENRLNPKYSNEEILVVMLLNKYLGYHQQEVIAKSRDDKLFTDNYLIPSQATISRIYNRIDEDTIEKFNTILLNMALDEIKKNQFIILDIDSSYVVCNGKQEGSAHNFHYNNHGYHPLIITEHYSKMVLAAKLRTGNKHCADGFESMIKPILDDERIDKTKLLLRMDSAFCSSSRFDFMDTCEVEYVCKMRKSNRLIDLVSKDIIDQASGNEKSVEGAEYFGYATYESDSYGSINIYYRGRMETDLKQQLLIPEYEIIVSTIPNKTAQEIFEIYNQRGECENIFHDLKQGMRLKNLSHSTFIKNEFEMLLSCFGYNVFKLFLKYVGVESKETTIVIFSRNYFKIAAKIVCHGRQTIVKMADNYRYKGNFNAMVKNLT